MTFYRQMGSIPHKRHTVFRKEDGTLYREQVMGTKGFSGIQSILYHHYPPTAVKKVSLIADMRPQFEEQETLKHRHFRTGDMNKQGDPISGRQFVLGNDDVLLGICRPAGEMNYFYRNGDGDELLFVHHGTGKLETMFGILPYEAGDYIVIPIGTIYRIVPDPGETKFLVIESANSIATPGRYRNEFGQFLEHSPFCERDIRGPVKLETYDGKGDFEVRTKMRGFMHAHILDHHPLDVVGWDGYLYPYTFNVRDFEPMTGRVHLPPPIHQTFEGQNFVVCSFVPRLYDYHPDAVPISYFHSNVDSDEVLYYVDGNFMSRKEVYAGSITLHPAGIPHGPHSGAIEASLGKKEALELAVMVDTFRPLKVVKQAKTVEDERYAYSWIEE